MSQCKSTTIINEIGHFFKKSEDNAMERILGLLKAVKMTDSGLGLKTKCNARRKASEKLQLLTLFPFFGSKNPYDYRHTSLAQVAVAGKDQFYRLLNDATVNWRNVGYKVFNALKRTTLNRGEQTESTCLIADDTDLNKTGFHIEFIGKVFSHVTHTHNLGFKMLALNYDDGKQMLNVDFSIHGEKGKKGNYGLTDRQLKKRKKVRHSQGNPDAERVMEYEESKIKVLMDMVVRFVRRGHKADYLLADSWFTNAQLVRFVEGLRNVGHYLGMARFSDTKYVVNGKEKSVKQIARSKTKRQRCRKLKCQYLEVDADFQGIPVKLFVNRMGKNQNWRVILTTDLTLNFEQAYRIYARRWNIEVFFKECKQHLGLGACQSHSFNAQIAATTVAMIQYNLLATARRFDGYETFGELFRAAGNEALELTVSQRIWLVICDVIKEIAEILEIDAETLLEKYIAEPERITKIVNLKTLQNAR